MCVPTFLEIHFSDCIILQTIVWHVHMREAKAGMHYPHSTKKPMIFWVAMVIIPLNSFVMLLALLPSSFYLCHNCVGWIDEKFNSVPTHVNLQFPKFWIPVFFWKFVKKRCFFHICVTTRKSSNNISTTLDLNSIIQNRNGKFPWHLIVMVVKW